MSVNIAYSWMFAWNAANLSFITEDLKGDLDIYVKSLEKEPNSLHLQEWGTLSRKASRARISRWNAAAADVLTILDAHVKVVVWMWLLLVTSNLCLCTNSTGRSLRPRVNEAVHTFFFYCFVVKQQIHLFSCSHSAVFTVYCADVGNAALLRRAEPLLTQIKAEGSEVASLVFDKVIYDHLKVKYSSVGQTFD